MDSNSIESRKDIENIAFNILNETKSFGVFPTPVDKIVKCAELKIDRGVDLSQEVPGFFTKKKEALKRALRKVLGAINVRQKVIYLDLKQSSQRKRFIKLHETGHGIIPWQQKIYEYLDDDESTLSPETKIIFEAEASLFASSVLFQLDRFEEEMKKLPLALASAITLSKMFGSSIHASLRRYVEFSTKRCALVIFEKIDFSTQGLQIRNYFHSVSFAEEFNSLDFDYLLNTPDLSFMEDILWGGRSAEGRVMLRTNDNILVTFEYHFYNNTYNYFIFLKPVGEKNKSRTKIILLN